MDIINNYDVIKYNECDIDKYTNEIMYQNCTIHYMNGKIHRENDLLAMIDAEGTQEWYVIGHLIR